MLLGPCVCWPQFSGAEIAEKKSLLCGKVCFGLITTAVKPGANISLQRAGIEQNRKGKPTQIVIGLPSKQPQHLDLLFICFSLFKLKYLSGEKRREKMLQFVFKNLNPAEGSQVGLSNLFNWGDKLTSHPRRRVELSEIYNTRIQAI